MTAATASSFPHIFHFINPGYKGLILVVSRKKFKISGETRTRDPSLLNICYCLLSESLKIRCVALNDKKLYYYQCEPIFSNFLENHTNPWFRGIFMPSSRAESRRVQRCTRCYVEDVNPNSLCHAPCSRFCLSNCCEQSENNTYRRIRPPNTLSFTPYSQM